jgi:hypothetical protein
MNESSLGTKREGLRDLGGLAGLVRVQAPTGEIRRMPRRMAEQFVARGAQVLD